eukprot:3938910-Rhodomonas_salina.9
MAGWPDPAAGLRRRGKDGSHKDAVGGGRRQGGREHGERRPAASSYVLRMGVRLCQVLASKLASETRG